MLYIFDLDGTLVESYGIQPLAGIPERLDRLMLEGHSLAVATNQAGPAWGIATRDPQYPTAESLGERFLEITKTLPQLTTVPWFVAVGDPRLSLESRAYAQLIQSFSEAASPLNLHLSADVEWRKPGPRMLLEACAYYGLKPEEASFVGDYKTDAEAAIAAGVTFIPIDEFL
jgi:HAD superfamily hydrolase (TIGR01662 family)